MKEDINIINSEKSKNVKNEDLTNEFLSIIDKFLNKNKKLELSKADSKQLEKFGTKISEIEDLLKEIPKEYNDELSVEGFNVLLKKFTKLKEKLEEAKNIVNIVELEELKTKFNFELTECIKPQQALLINFQLKSQELLLRKIKELFSKFLEIDNCLIEIDGKKETLLLSYKSLKIKWEDFQKNLLNMNLYFEKYQEYLKSQNLKDTPSLLQDINKLKNDEKMVTEKMQPLPNLYRKAKKEDIKNKLEEFDKYLSEIEEISLNKKQLDVLNPYQRNLSDIWKTLDEFSKELISKDMEPVNGIKQQVSFFIPQVVRDFTPAPVKNESRAELVTKIEKFGLRINSLKKIVNNKIDDINGPGKELTKYFNDNKTSEEKTLNWLIAQISLLFSNNNKEEKDMGEKNNLNQQKNS